MSLLSTSEEKRGTEEETGRRNRCQRELKGLGPGEVIGIRKQSAKPEGIAAQTHLQHTA